MKRLLLGMSVTVLMSLPGSAQIFQFSRDQMIKFTAQNPFDRFPDGRPKIPESLLEKMKGLTCEEIFGPLMGKKFVNQFEGNWHVLHPERKLVGRAVTAQFMPYRPDIGDIAEADARAKGLGPNANERVIDMLQPGDVLVVDLFGKIENGPIVGDNLATAIFAASGNGFVIDGAIRDLEGIYPMEMAAYFRGAHPSAVNSVMLTAVNVPVRIGNATVVPGDLVFGDREGVYFVPPQFVEEIVKRADETHIHDEWTKAKFMTGKYKASDLYPRPTDPALKEEYEAYKKKRLGH